MIQPKRATCPCCQHDAPTLESLGWRLTDTSLYGDGDYTWVKFDDCDREIAGEGDDVWEADLKRVHGEAL